MKKNFYTILIASGNKGKLVEIADLLSKVGIKAISAADFNLPEPEETGNSFEANSVIKAKYYGDKTGLIALADDSGLCIDLLNNKPGIHSARWAFDEKTNSKNFAFAFDKIKQELSAKNIDLENEKITAHFICNLTLYFPKNKEIIPFPILDQALNLGLHKPILMGTQEQDQKNLIASPKTTNIVRSFEGRVDGRITFPSRGDNGFGYDPIFIADGCKKTFGEMLAKDKDKISHRTKAFDQLIAHYNQLLASN